MAKKLLKDYTPEQRYKLERRVIRRAVKHDPESQELFNSVILDIIGSGKARTDALAFRQASDDLGRGDFDKWCAENPLSSRAALHVGMIEQEIAAPAVAHGNKFTPKRKKGAKSKKTVYIESLCTNNPTLRAKELFNLADKKIIGEMKQGTFANHVSEARK